MKRLWLLAAIILTFGAVAVWQHRFEVVLGALPETHLSDPLVGWSCPPNQQFRILEEDGETVLRLERKSPDQPFPEIGIWLGQLEQVDFIHVRCEARWADVVRGPEPYHDARLAITPRTRDGSIHYPPEGRLFSGTGSSGWQRHEVVFGLTPDFIKTGIRMGMSGDSGRLEIRNLTLVAVRQRPWVPVAIAAILLGWTYLLAAFIRRQSIGLEWWRTLAAASLAVVFCWFFIFPQARDHFKPLTGPLSVRGLPELPELPNATPTLASRRASSGSQSPYNTAARDKFPPTTFHRFLRYLDERFEGLHFILFSAFTFAFLMITGCASQWRLPLALAILAELIPELTDHLGGKDDWIDLITNLAGVGFALLIWRYLPALNRFHRSNGSPCH